VKGGKNMVKKKIKNNMFTRGREDKCCWHHGKGCGGAFYGLGFIGSAIYYISNATGFWMGVLGILKSIVWPAFLVFELLKLVGA